MVRDPTPLGADTPTLDQLVPIVPELSVMLVVVGLVVWLAWRILVTLDRELDRRHGSRPRRLDEAVAELVDTREAKNGDDPREP